MKVDMKKKKSQTKSKENKKKANKKQKTSGSSRAPDLWNRDEGLKAITGKVLMFSSICWLVPKNKLKWQPPTFIFTER